MSQASESLSRDLSLFDITMIGVGAMIGAGIFVLTGEAAGIAGPALVLSFALNGIVTIFTAMVYAELGSAIPEAGGGYLWIKKGLPGGNAFLAGWMSWFAHAVAGALYALGFGAFLFELTRIFGMPWEALGLDLDLARKSFGLAVAAVFAGINFRGSSETGLAGNIVTVAKIGIIGVFCLFGLRFMFFPELGPQIGEATGGMGLDQLRPFIPEETGWLGILSAMGLTFIAFEGYEIIVQAGEEVKDPRRNIPKAVFLSLAIVVPVYMLVAFVLVGATDSSLLIGALREMGETVPEGIDAGAPSWQVLRHVGELGLARAASQFVPWGAALILLGGLFSTMSALNATTFSSTRVAFAMGRDRNLPDAFGSIHPATHTPHVALLWTAVLIGVMVAFVPLTTVAAAADIMFLLLFLQVNVAVITLRKKYGTALAYGYLMPYYPVVPIIGIVTKLGLALFMFDHYPVAWVYVILWLGVGLAIYRLYARERERQEEAPPVLAEESPLAVRESAVLAAIGPDHGADSLLRVGVGLARARESELVLMHAVVLPRQTPLRAATPFAAEAREYLAEARDRAEAEGADVRTILRLGHRPAHAIVHTIRDHDIEYALMGWQRHWDRRWRLGRNIDRVVRDVNVNVVVVEEDDRQAAGDVERILIPIARPATAPLAIAVASGLLDRWSEGAITLLHLTERPLGQEAQDAFRNEIVGRAHEAEESEELPLFDEGSPLAIEFGVHGGHLAAEIGRRSESYDRVVLGIGHNDGVLRRVVLGDKTRRIAFRSGCPVVFVRPRAGAMRFGIQQFFQFFRDLEEEEEDVAPKAEEAPEDVAEETEAASEDPEPSRTAETANDGDEAGDAGGEDAGDERRSREE